MGKRRFEQGEASWPEEAPFRTPVYVLTHEQREAWVRPGGTTFYFVDDGPERALEQARAAAGGRDIRISGGAGRRLPENITEPLPQFRIDAVMQGPAATHIRYGRD